MSWYGDLNLTGSARSDSGWLEELIRDASKTIAVGEATHKNVLGLYMRVGTCPECGAHVERRSSDVFFPYCSYSCKRVEQRKEEEKERERIKRQEQRYYEQKKRDNAKHQERKRKARQARMQDNLKAYIEDGWKKYEEASRNAACAPKSSQLRHRELSKARRWYTRIIEAQRRLKEMEAQHEG